MNRREAFRLLGIGAVAFSGVLFGAKPEPVEDDGLGYQRRMTHELGASLGEKWDAERRLGFTDAPPRSVSYEVWDEWA